jgi:hypothetical protein
MEGAEEETLILILRPSQWYTAPNLMSGIAIRWDIRTLPKSKRPSVSCPSCGKSPEDLELLRVRDHHNAQIVCPRCLLSTPCTQNENKLGRDWDVAAGRYAAGQAEPAVLAGEDLSGLFDKAYSHPSRTRSVKNTSDIPKEDCPCGRKAEDLKWFFSPLVHRGPQLGCPVCKRTVSHHAVDGYIPMDRIIARWDRAVRTYKEINRRTTMTTITNRKQALIKAAEIIESQHCQGLTGPYTIDITKDPVEHQVRVHTQGEHQAVIIPYTPPRVAPPKGTPVLVWPKGASKQLACLGISRGTTWENETANVYLRVTVNGEDTTSYNWSVLVEKEEVQS